MSRQKNIPGHMDVHALALLAATGTEPEAAAEARRLAAAGWRPDDIAAAMRTDRRQVAAWLAGDQ